MIVKTLRPRDYNDALHVGHYFRKGIPVVMDLTTLTEEEGGPLIDFAAGLVYSRGGDIRRVDSRVFVLTPAAPASPDALATVVKHLRPASYNDALYVGHYFREGMTVVMDLTALPDAEARRFVDFAAGLISARGGDMDRLSPKVFQLVPAAPAGARPAGTGPAPRGG